ncbi:MAG: hypothetical protein H6727_04305 [Myxococcales bacterium]|nr:hypothetical protein [Myxococcales bacterium]
MNTQHSLTSMDSQAIHLQDLSKPRVAELVELVRLLRAVINAFRMYPPGNQMIQRSVDRFARGMKTLCDSLGQLVLSFVSDTIELNGEPVPRTVAESRLASELAKIFMARGVNTVIFDNNTQVQEFAEWLAFISRQDVEDEDASFRIDRQQTSFPHLKLNRQVVTRHTSDQMRDKLSVREIVASMDRDSLLKELGLDDEQLAPEFLEALEQPHAPSFPEAGSGVMQGLEPKDVGQRAERQLDLLLRSGRFVFTLIKRETRLQRERNLRQTRAGSSKPKAGTSPLLSTVDARRESPSQGYLPTVSGQYLSSAPMPEPSRSLSHLVGSSLPTVTGSMEREGPPVGALPSRPPTQGNLGALTGQIPTGVGLPPQVPQVLQGMPVVDDMPSPSKGSRGLLEVLSEGIQGRSPNPTMQASVVGPAPIESFLGEPSESPIGLAQTAPLGPQAGALPWVGDLPARGGGALHTQGVTSVPNPLDPSMFLPADLFYDAPAAEEAGFGPDGDAFSQADPLLDALSNALSQRQDLFPEQQIEETQLPPEDRLQLPSLAELLAAADRDMRAAQEEEEMTTEVASALAQLLTWQEQLQHTSHFSQEKLHHNVPPQGSLGIATHPLDVSTNSLEMFDVTRQAEEAAALAGAEVSSAQADVGGFVDLTVSLDNLDASDARQVIEERGPSEAFDTSISFSQAHTSSPPLPSFDAIDWSKAAEIPQERWPQQLRLEEFVQLEQFPQFIQQSDFPKYLRASLQGAQHRVKSPEDVVSLVSPLTQKTIQQDLERFGRAISQLQDDFLRRTFMLGVLQQVASLDEPIIAQYWLQASPEDSFGKALRRGLLQALPSASIQGVQRELITKIQYSPNRELLESALSLSKDIMDAQLQTSNWKDVRNMVSLLEERSQKNPSRRLLYSLRELLGHLKTQHRMTHILREGMHPQAEEARSLLSELAPESLPLCARFLIKSPAGPLREQQAEIFAEVARRADSERADSAFHIIFEFFDHHPPSLEMWQIFCEIARSCAQDVLESVILDHIQREQSPRSFHLWMTQALLHPSPRLQWWLDQCLRQRALSHLPHLEEMIFSAWLQAGYVDGSNFLRDEILNPNRTSAQRHHAVWMLGCLRPEESRALFEELLFSPMAPVLGERLRFQLMFALWGRAHGAWRRTMMQKLSADDSPVIRQIAATLSLHTYSTPKSPPVSGGILPPDEILLAPVEVIQKVPLFQPMPPGALTQEMQKVAQAQASGQTAPGARPSTSPGVKPPTSPGASSAVRPAPGGYPTTKERAAGKSTRPNYKPPSPSSGGVSGSVLALGFFAVVAAIASLLYLYLSGS